MAWYFLSYCRITLIAEKPSAVSRPCGGVTRRCPLRRRQGSLQQLSIQPPLCKKFHTATRQKRVMVNPQRRIRKLRMVDYTFLGDFLWSWDSTP